jgi:hypothetical protein
VPWLRQIEQTNGVADLQIARVDGEVTTDVQRGTKLITSRSGPADIVLRTCRLDTVQSLVACRELGRVPSDRVAQKVPRRPVGNFDISNNRATTPTNPPRLSSIA